MRVAIALLATLCVSSVEARGVLIVGDEKMRMCAPGERNTPTKTCVVDGDTIWLHGRNYRLQGFDTPEPQTRICGGEVEKALARRASSRLVELLNSNAWTVEAFGVDDLGGSREIATIWLGDIDVGDILIREGLAREWPDGAEFWCP